MQNPVKIPRFSHKGFYEQCNKAESQLPGSETKKHEWTWRFPLNKYLNTKQWLR